MMQIIETTDGKFEGSIFDETQNPIQLSNDVFIPIDRVVSLNANTKRFINSSYVIDAKEID